MGAKLKYIVGAAVIVAALSWLIFVSSQESKTYYITVDEFDSMAGRLQGKTVKVAGDVLAGSIDRAKPQMEFVIGSSRKQIRVRYIGKDVIPDTFKDGSQALVEGNIAGDGTFQARHIEAKCASKYEAEYQKKKAS
jgi:cytochrome c-type biogenesis protein CcmE